jgi:ACT domain-containing protein
MPTGTGAEIRLRIRVWLPDRPGALGLVASRIGSLGADIVGVEV